MTVFAGSRIRDNNVFGTTTDNPLSNVAVTLNSAGLTSLSAVSGNHAVLVLDPLRAAGAPEIVIVTAHTGAATSATITRGAYGTAARSHASGTLWVLAATVDDLIRICTSGTRPADQYEGQLVYETDTDSYKGHNGTAWEQVVTLGGWTAWVPTLTNLTLGNGTVTARYLKVGRGVWWRFRMTLGSTSAVGTNPQFSLPVAAEASYVVDADVMGDVDFRDTGTANYRGQMWYVSATVIRFVAFTPAAATVSATVPHTWAATDTLGAAGFYEAAA